MHWGEGSGDTRRRTISRWSTYDVSVLKKLGGRCAQTGHPLKLPSPTKLARRGHFTPASQAGRLAGPMLYEYGFSLLIVKTVKMPYSAGYGLFMENGDDIDKDNLDKRRGDSAKNDRSVSFLFASMNFPLNPQKAD